METIITFILASSLISVAPGPDNIFVLTQSALYGKKSGLFITLGLCSGLIFRTAAVALGVAALFQASPLAFAILKYLSATYLAYLAWQVFTAPATRLTSNSEKGLSYRALYLREIIMNVTNPKVSIFFLAFLPQFTQPAYGHLSMQFIILGMIFIAVAFTVFNFIAVMAGSLGNWFTRSDKQQIYLNRLAGTVFIGLAVKLVTSTATA